MRLHLEDPSWCFRSDRTLRKPSACGSNRRCVVCGWWWWRCVCVCGRGAGRLHPNQHRHRHRKSTTQSHHHGHPWTHTATHIDDAGASSPAGTAATALMDSKMVAGGGISAVGNVCTALVTSIPAVCGSRLLVGVGAAANGPASHAPCTVTVQLVHTRARRTSLAKAVIQRTHQRQPHRSSTPTPPRCLCPPTLGNTPPPGAPAGRVALRASRPSCFWVGAELLRSRRTQPCDGAVVGP